LLSSLAYRPKLVVLDEPFSGLDPLVRDEFIHGLLELTEEEGWTVFVSSHDIEEVERLADRVAIIHQGRLQLDEGNEALQRRFRRVEVSLDDVATASIPTSVEWLNVKTDGRLVSFVHSRHAPDRLETEVRSVYGSHARAEAHPMTLREIFVALARTYRLGGETAVTGRGET